MPNPLTAFPNELWTICIALAIDGHPTGPLELLMVSPQWARMLLNSPSLWSQIYIQNGEDEMARISTFLHLSKRYSLYVDIMTVLPTTDSLQLIAENISRVATISIRPGTSDNFSMEQWRRAASNIMSILSNGRLPLSISCTSYFGITLVENGQFYHRTILMLFTPAISVASSEKQKSVVSVGSPDTITCFRRWEEHIASCICIPSALDTEARTASIDSATNLASYARYHDAIRIAVPYFIRLLGDDYSSVRPATTNAIHKFAVHVEPRGAIRVAISQLISLLYKDYNVQETVTSVIDSLSEYDEFQEPLQVAIPLLIKFLHHSLKKCRRDSLSAIGKLAKHDESRDMIRAAVPSLVKLLHHADADIGRHALSVIEALVEHSEHNKSLDLLRVVIPSLVELLHHGDTAVQKLGIIGLQNLAERNQFHELLRAAIPSIVELLDHRDMVVRVCAFTAIQRLAVYDEFHEALSIAIPFIAPLLKPGSSVQSAVASAMPEICGYRKMSWVYGEY